MFFFVAENIAPKFLQVCQSFEQNGVEWDLFGKEAFNELTWFPRIPFSCFMQKLRFKTISDIFCIILRFTFLFQSFEQKTEF